MMGSTEDPEDGKAVATAVFGAVTVYAVSLLLPFRAASSPTPAGQPASQPASRPRPSFFAMARNRAAAVITLATGG